MRAVIAALESEAAAIRHALRPGDKLYVCGVGKVAAAAATARAIAEGATEVLNAGVAGGMPRATELFGIYEIARATEYDFDLASVNGTGPGVHDGRATPYFTLSPMGLFPARTLGTGDRFRDGETDLPLLESLGVEVRDMEGAAIAHVCETAGVPCRSLKCITNLVGSSASRGFRDNLPKALECLRAALSSWM